MLIHDNHIDICVNFILERGMCMSCRELTIGSRHGLASVMVKELMMTGWKSKILGYMSSGDRVPDVITTV
jgi:hypothetical protein